MTTPKHETRATIFEAYDDIPVHDHLSRTLGDIVDRRFNRRTAVTGMLAVAVTSKMLSASPAALAAVQATTAQFNELESGVDETHHVAEGYSSDILLRWGDPVFADSPAFDPDNQSAQAQLRQFGYNNDFIGILPLNRQGTSALLCVNHEYTSTEVMQPGISARPDKNDFREITREKAEIEMAAHGGTVIEITQENGKWKPVLDSKYNRRISPLDTEMHVDGPARGHARMKTSADASGERIMGTFNNCAGGITPWGTWLMAEENFHGYFWTDERDANGKRLKKGLGGDQKESYERYGVPANWYNWGEYVDRFNVAKEPNEPNRHGWIVEVDPMDPGSTPVKHTGLGRFRHEGSECIVNTDGRVIVYSGDDARFEYLYRFVSNRKFRKGYDRHNRTLLSDGVLSVARFNEDGTLDWLPLIFGKNGLTPDNGFESQADVVIDARLAADILGATPMDRPEDVEPSAETGKTYVMLTNNHKRKDDQINASNPRAVNHFGHIIELTAPDRDHAADRMTWEILVKCGDPAKGDVGAMWNPATTKHGWFGSPDNCAIDARGRLWISTDQGTKWGKTGKADGLYALDTEGEARGRSRLFFRVPVGAELCGPRFTADSKHLFLAVQHPGTDGVKDYKPFGRASTFADPATRWPDFAKGIPPRPSVVVVRKDDGGEI